MKTSEDFPFRDDTTSTDLLDKNKIQSYGKYTKQAFCFVTIITIMNTSSIIDDNSSDNSENQIEWTYNNNTFQQRSETNRLHSRLAELIKMFKCSKEEDDDDLIAINESVIGNFKSLLQKCENDNYLIGWNLFSNNKGGLSLEHQSNNISSIINIGKTHITYFYDNKKNATQITGQEPFSTDNILTILKKPYDNGEQLNTISREHL